MTCPEHSYTKAHRASTGSPSSQWRHGTHATARQATCCRRTSCAQTSTHAMPTSTARTSVFAARATSRVSPHSTRQPSWPPSGGATWCWAKDRSSFTRPTSAVCTPMLPMVGLLSDRAVWCGLARMATVRRCPTLCGMSYSAMPLATPRTATTAATRRSTW